MQDLWTVGAASLLNVLIEVRGGSRDEALSDLGPSRARAAAPSWPGLLTRLRPMEAALLQDVTWWGTKMEEQLHRWSQEPNAAGRCECEAAR
jgi:hypothetical protein